MKEYKKHYYCQDWTVEQIAKAFKGEDELGRKIIIPLFQRGKRWKKEDKTELIKSLREGFPVGSMLFAELGNKQFSVVDGLQRGSTIVDYIFSPTKLENLQKIDEDILNQISQCLYPQNQNKTLNEVIENKIFEYFSSQKSFNDISINALARKLINEFPNESIDKFITNGELNDILKPWFKTYKDFYDKIAKAEIPVVIYCGSENHLNTIFKKINDQGLDLTEYEIYASSWQQYRKVAPEEIVNFVLKKYDVLLKEGYEIQDYNPETLRMSKELQPFEYLFGLGKWLHQTYGQWLRIKGHYKDDAICEIGFEIVNICINNKKEDVSELDKRLKEISFTTLFRRVKEAIQFTIEATKSVSSFKGNARKTDFLHSQRQILSMIGFVFREMYDIDNLDTKKHSWKEHQKKISQNLLHHYVYDIISGYWAAGSEKPYSAIKEKKYYIEKSKNAWSSLLNNYFESSLQKNDNPEKIANPSTADKVILNCIYLDLFTAKDQLGNGNFDIEHLATKKLMKTHMINTKISGLPVASIGNQCYLPEFPNREKKEKTIYQKYGNEGKIITLIENKYSFTAEEDLEWIELPFESQDQQALREYFEGFLRKRFSVMIKKFLNSLDIVPVLDWEQVLREKQNTTFNVFDGENTTNVAGVYVLSNIENDLTWSALEKIIYKGNEILVKTWKGLLNEICNLAYKKDKIKFMDIVANNIIHKSDSKLNPTGKDPIITKDKKLVQKSMLIENTQFFTEGCISCNRAIFYSKKIAEIFDLAEEIKIQVRDRGRN